MCTEPESNKTDNRDILEKLESLEGMRVEEIPPQNGFNRQFVVFLEQPVDHNDESSSTFEQRIYISHINEYNPVVFMPSGYGTSPIKKAEICDPLEANQIYVAHRYMAGASTNQPDWGYLTIEQASADFHLVVNTLKQVYEGGWISYGVSKNAQSALFHKRFFPDDVDATLAVTPALSIAAEDPRYTSFLNSVGNLESRSKVIDFQRRALSQRASILPLISSYMATSEYHYYRNTAGKILEYEILEFPFSFWQISTDVSTIPDSTATPNEMYEYLRDFGYFDFYSNELMDYFAPVYYQAFTEMGWYELDDTNVQDLLVDLSDPSYKNFGPEGIEMQYNPEIMQDIVNWLMNSGDNIIYVYGDLDPWSASALDIEESPLRIRIDVPDASHSIKIADLNERDLIFTTLGNWIRTEFN